MSQDAILLQGVRTNNLKSLDVAIPLGSYTVVTGKSGSGKSSLVFDTLYGEAYRRYVESLSSFARQYLKALPKPELDNIENIPAAIAVKQARAGQNNRSTVGTMTELDELMRVIYGHLSEPHCCGKPVRAESPKSITELSYGRWAGESVLVMASMEPWSKLKAAELKGQLAGQGFTRALVDGELRRIEDSPAKDLRQGYVVVDRVKLTEGNYHRLAESCKLALKLGRGTVYIADPKLDQLRFSNQLRCDECDSLYHRPSPSLFNFNNPQGACESCQGFGRVPVLDHYKIFPNEEESLSSKGVAPWNFGKHVAYYRLAINSGKDKGVEADRPFSSYTEEQWNWLYNGDAKGGFKGIQGYFAWLDSKKYKAHYRIHSARFHSYDTCDECQGQRLKPESLRYLVKGQSIAQLAKITLSKLCLWLEELQKEQKDLKLRGLDEALGESIQRLKYLITIGVHYLSLGRATKSLSGGEVQRINMARSLGSFLTDTLFCLDEPSSGLHPRDSDRLLSVIKELRDQGNTVVVVEHEQGLIQGADHLIRIGPEAGFEGGELTYQGVPKELAVEVTPFPLSEHKVSSPQSLQLQGADVNNLKSVEAQIPLNCLVAVCGVSGSGKTSLIRHSLFPLLCEHLGQSWEGEEGPGGASLGPESLLKQFATAHLMSQEPIGRSSRSNIASYLGIYTEIRKLFANTPMAQGQKMKPGYFSFNVPGGRCEECKGLGLVEEDLSFLGDMKVTCPKCQGLRFQESVLDIKYREKSLLEVLQLTVAEARGFFFDVPKIMKVLDQIQQVGMDYVTLGQNTSSFSGGEAQRLKILSFLLENKDSQPRIFIFDEPTTGLSDLDVAQLLEQMRLLVHRGHSVVVVEHHLGVIKSSDWVLEMGPEAADQGGQIVFQGTPRQLMDESTITAGFLRGLP